MSRKVGFVRKCIATVRATEALVRIKDFSYGQSKLSLGSIKAQNQIKENIEITHKYFVSQQDSKVLIFLQLITVLERGE